MPARCRTVPAGAPLCTDRSMPMTATVAGNLSADCRRIMTERTGDRRKPRVRVIDENGANLFAFMGGQGWHAGSPSVRLHVCTGHRDRIMHYRCNLPTLQSVDRLAYRGRMWGRRSRGHLSAFGYLAVGAIGSQVFPPTSGSSCAQI